MKFFPTVPLALALAAGVAVAAAAQTTPGTSDSKSMITKPSAGSTQSPQGLNDNKATLNDNKAASSTGMQSVEPNAKSAQIKAAQPQIKRTAHLRATHSRRMAQMRTARRAERLRTAAVEPTGSARSLNPAQVKQAQEELRAAGLYKGPSDGMMDPDTRAALARFQQQNGLRRTETLDQQTLARLNGTQTTTGFGSSSQGSATPPAAAGGNTTQQQPITH